MPINRPSEARIQNFIDDFMAEPLVKKYLSKHSWLSGSTTVVRPIELEKRAIRVLWSSDKQIFDKFINRTVQKHSDIFSDGRFCKSDGSWPSTITFYFKNA